MTQTFLIYATLFLCAASAQEHQDPHRAMHERGARVMGFDQEKTTHHFFMYSDGGAIDVSANAKEDTESRDAIHSHLPHVAVMFGDGDFSAPVLVHAQDPPGARVLAERKDHIRYTYVETPGGGKVDIVTHDEKALEALHAFLRFQITDHQTGDTLEVSRR